MAMRRVAAGLKTRVSRSRILEGVSQQTKCLVAVKPTVGSSCDSVSSGWMLAAAAGVAGASAAALCDSKSGAKGPYVVQRADVKFDSSLDVIAVGSGAAGCTAALSAKWAGAGDVVLLEKDPKEWGGTTAKSGGTFWIPNNPLLQDQGVQDQKQPTLRFMAKLSYPDKYNPKSPTLGLSEREFGWLSQYYDLGSHVCKEMQEHKVMPLAQAKFHDGQPMFDYNHDDENPVRQGRLLGCGMDAWMRKTIHGTNAVTKNLGGLRTWMPAMKEVLFLQEFGLDITYGIGLNLADKLKKGLKSSNVDIKMGHSVEAVVVDGDRVCGVRVGTPSGVKFIEARKGVIFGSGGFSNSEELRAKYLKDRPIDGTGASKGNDGILVHVGEGLGLDLVNMDCVWGSQCYVEESQKTFETASNIFMMRGDSVMVVNNTGVRVMNEKSPYNNRKKVHDVPGNRYLFVIADQRAVDLYGCNFSKTLPGSPGDKLYIKGKTIAEFSQNLRSRLAAVAANGGATLALSDDFETSLAATITKFNGYAKEGKDLDFNRGETDSSKQWTYDHKAGVPNKCMYPIDTSTLYGVIIGPQSLDTKGGPQLDLNASCLSKGKPMAGLYACGNAAAGATSADAYWSGGATIGNAMVTGWVAGQHAAKQ